MVEISKGIVGQKNPYVEARKIARDEIRKHELEEKAKTSGLTKLEKLELTKIKLQGLLDTDTYVKNVAFCGNVNNVQNPVTLEQTADLIERKKDGLNSEVIKEILELPKEQAALFLKKDITGNYMIPTKILNRLTQYKSIKITSNDDGSVTLKTFGTKINTYTISHRKVIPITDKIVIKDANTEATLTCYGLGNYEEKTYGILKNTSKKGQTADLN